MWLSWDLGVAAWQDPNSTLTGILLRSYAFRANDASLTRAPPHGGGSFFRRCDHAGCWSEEVREDEAGRLDHSLQAGHAGPSYATTGAGKPLLPRRKRAAALKTELRRQVTSAGLGQRLARTWRDRHYDNPGLDAATLGLHRAPQIIRAFDQGAVIRSRSGAWLAIPTPNAPRRGVGGKRINPSNFPEHRFGPLRFVYRRSGPSLLVVDGLRASVSRKTGELRGFRRASERARRTGPRGGDGGDVPSGAAGEDPEAARCGPGGRALAGLRLPALVDQQIRAD